MNRKDTIQGFAVKVPSCRSAAGTDTCRFLGPSDKANSPVFSKGHSLSGARILNRGWGGFIPQVRAGNVWRIVGCHTWGSAPDMRWVRPGPLLGPLRCTQHPEKDGDPALPPAALTGTKPALQGYLQVCLGSWHTDIPIHLNFDSRLFPEKMINNFIVSNMSYEHNAGLGRAHAELQWEERGAGHKQRARGLQTDGWTDGTPR